MVKMGQKRDKKSPLKKKKARKVGQRSLQRKADILFSNLVRKAGKCEYCGKKGLTLHCHHAVVHRRYLNTRYDFSNVICVCVSCHRFLGDFPKLNTEFMIKKIGSRAVEELQIRAMTNTGAKFDYEEVLRKLK